MRRVYTGLMAGLMLLGAATHGRAMVEYNADEVVYEEDGCWRSNADNYAATGEAKGGTYLWVWTVAPADSPPDVKLFDDKFALLKPVFVKEANGKPAGSFKGFNQFGAAVFWVPKKVRYSLMYYSDWNTRTTYDGKMIVCPADKVE